METAKKSVGYGTRGWGIIFFTMSLMFVNGMIHTNGMNVLLNIINQQHGWDVSTLLNMNTVSGIIGVGCSFIIGRLIVKFGAKMIGAIYLILGGFVIMWFGHVNSLTAFFLALTFLWVLSDGYGQMVPFTLVANWFPRRKGTALGIATMGYPLCTGLAVLILTTLIGFVGYGNTFIILGIVNIALGIIMFFIHNYPEEVGVAPDNDPAGREELEKMIEHRKNYKSELTVKIVLKDKRTWKIAVCMGFLWMCTIGIASQLMPRMLAVGIDPGFASKLMMVTGFFGLFGSWLFGWIDEKIGTRKATMIYCWFYVAVFIGLIVAHTPAPMLVVAMAGGTGTGAVCNLLPSMISSAFGRDDFPIANGIISPMASMLRCMNFTILAIGLKINGSYTPAYVIFIVMSIVSYVIAYTMTKDLKY